MLHLVEKHWGESLYTVGEELFNLFKTRSTGIRKDELSYFE